MPVIRRPDGHRQEVFEEGRERRGRHLVSGCGVLIGHEHGVPRSVAGQVATHAHEPVGQVVSGVDVAQNPDLGVEDPAGWRCNLEDRVLGEHGELAVGRRHVDAAGLTEDRGALGVAADGLEQLVRRRALHATFALVVGRHGQRRQQQRVDGERVGRRDRSIQAEARRWSQGVGEQVADVGVQHVRPRAQRRRRSGGVLRCSTGSRVPRCLRRRPRSIGRPDRSAAPERASAGAPGARRGREPQRCHVHPPRPAPTSSSRNLCVAGRIRGLSLYIRDQNCARSQSRKTPVAFSSPAHRSSLSAYSSRTSSLPVSSAIITL